MADRQIKVPLRLYKELQGRKQRLKKDLGINVPFYTLLKNYEGEDIIINSKKKNKRFRL